MNLIQRLGLALIGGEHKAATLVTQRREPFAAPNSMPVINYEWSAERTTREGLAQNSWLYVAVNLKARALASVPLVVEKRTVNGWEQDPEHPVQLLLDRPNPFMARQDLMERLGQHLELTGNAVWHKVKVKGVTVELWPVLPEQITPIPSRKNYLDGYDYRPTPQDKVRLKVDEVLHWQYQNPANPYWGLAPVQAAALVVDGDVEALKWNRNVLANGARPIGVMSLDAQLTTDQWKMAQEMVAQQIGGASKARQFLVVGGATHVQSFGFSPTDMDWIGGRKLNREEIFAVIGVPPILAVQGDGATYANMQGAEKWFWTSVLSPLLDDFTRTLEISLLPEFGSERTHRIRADLSIVPALRENEKDKATVALLYFQAGFDPTSVALHLQLPLTAIPNATALPANPANAMKSLSPPATVWVEQRIGRELKSLSPPEALQVALALGSGNPEAALGALEWP